VNISAVVVTKGDQDISAVVQSLSAFDEVIVRDNSKYLDDLKVFGRYAAAMNARNPVIYVQDDDCIVPAQRIAQSYESMIQSIQDLVVCNVPVSRRSDYQGTGITLMGWGSVFERSAIYVFDQYLKVYPRDDLFLRECDRVFSYLHRFGIHLVDYPVEHLAWARGADRMGRELRHGRDLKQIRGRLEALKPMPMKANA
jgi:hypothetical protein